MCCLQLFPACQLGIHICNFGIPLLSDLFCQGSLYFCQITQFSSVLTLAMPEHGSVNVYDVRKQARPALLLTGRKIHFALQQLCH